MDLRRHWQFWGLLTLALTLLAMGLGASRNPRSPDGTAAFFFVLGVLNIIVTVRYYLRIKAQAPKPDEIDLSPLTPATIHSYTIYPAKNKFDPPAGIALMRSLLRLHPFVTFHIHADAERIVWQIADPTGKARPQSIIDAVKSHAPEAVVTLNETEETTSGQSQFRQQHFFGLANEYAVPIAGLDRLKDDDPLTAVANRMSLLKPNQGESITLTLIVTTPTHAAKTRAWERLREGSVLALSAVPTEREDDNLHTLDERLLNAKLAGTLYHAFLVATVESTLHDRIVDLAGIVPDIARFAIPRHNHLIDAGHTQVLRVTEPAPPLISDTFRTLFLNATDKNAPWRPYFMVLSTEELAALWHLPDERFTASRIAWAGIPIPEAVTAGTSDSVQLGTTAGTGHKTPAFLKLADRAYHAYATGKTGTGKSTLLHNLIHQDVAAGRGVVVIDPHGKLIDDVLARSIPASRQADVVALRLGDADRPIPLNPFRIPEGGSSDATFNLVYWVFRKLFESVWKDRMDYVLRNVIQTLLTDPEATPRDIQRVLLEADYRQQVLATLTDADWSLRAFWNWFEAQSPSERMEIASPILTRTGTFLNNRALSLMTCHPKTLPMRTLIGEQRIVLANLSGDMIASEVGTIGAILLAQIFVASQSLGYLNDGELPRTYVYIDEVERIVTTPIPEMFATARKFGLSLTLANQYLTQLSQETQEGILGNVGTQLIFEVGERDSRALSRQVEPEIEREQLLKLGAYQMAVKTRADGVSLPAFLVKTLPPPQPQVSHVNVDGDMRYRPLTDAQVQDWLAKRYAAKPKPNGDEEAASAEPLGDYE